MARFAVKRGRDAYVIEEAIIEADCEADALDIAKHGEGIQWDDVDEVREFDDTVVLDDEVEELGPTTEVLDLHRLKAEERDIIIAALRLWQATPLEQVEGLIQEIACNGRDAPLDDNAIHDLCQRLSMIETYELEDELEDERDEGTTVVVNVAPAG